MKHSFAIHQCDALQASLFARHAITNRYIIMRESPYSSSACSRAGTNPSIRTVPTSGHAPHTRVRAPQPDARAAAGCAHSAVCYHPFAWWASAQAESHFVSVTCHSHTVTERVTVVLPGSDSCDNDTVSDTCDHVIVTTCHSYGYSRRLLPLLGPQAVGPEVQWPQ